MRLNVFIAQSSGLSRRAADTAIEQGRVSVNGLLPVLGQKVDPKDRVTLDKRAITPSVKTTTVMFNKPVGYVCSRVGQGSKTIYDLLPDEYHKLKPVGRLDKDSSGLLLLTDDGQLANELTHPRFQKTKTYEVQLDRSLPKEDFDKIIDVGVDIGDKSKSRFQLVASSRQYVVSKGRDPKIPYYFLPTTYYWRATLAEGRNRQIRRTFETLGYRVVNLHRTGFGTYQLWRLSSGKYKQI